MVVAAALGRHARLVRAIAMLLVGRFMHVMDCVLDMLRRGPARLAVEGQEDQPPRIETRQQGSDRSEPEGDRSRHRSARPGALEDRVLRPESGKADPRDTDTGDRHRASDHYPEGERDLLP